MMHSSSGCGEKMSAFGASAAHCRMRRHREAAELELLAVVRELRQRRHVLQVRIAAAHRATSGRLAAAIAWPCRLSFSSGTWKVMRRASSGNSTSQHAARAVDDVVAARPRGDATEHEHVRDVVEVGEVRDAVAKVRAERLVDLPARRRRPRPRNFCTTFSFSGSPMSAGVSMPATAPGGRRPAARSTGSRHRSRRTIRPPARRG